MYNPNRSTWVNPNIEYLFNERIVEYDMRDAGFNILKHFKLVAPEEIRRLEGLDKMERLIAIGKLQINNKELVDALNTKFTEMRTLFIGENRLTDNQIISVKKDAIYTIGGVTKLKFGGVEFIVKGEYSSYLRFVDNHNIEIYYRGGEMDIKGIGESGINRHRLYLLTFLNRVISNLETKNPSLKRYLRQFISDYKGSRLDDGYYLEFNNLSRDFNPTYNYQRLIIPIVQIVQRELN